MEEPTVADSPLARAARWFQATPAELTGLAVLLTGALVASALLWWSATGRPAELPGSAAAQVGEVVRGDADPDALAPGDGGAGGGEDPAGGGATASEGGLQGQGGAAPPGDPADPGSGPEADVTVTVHVTGAVGAPGVVVLAGGARVADAVAAAGGLTPDAAPDLINLARPLTDGEHVHVPRPGETPPVPPPSDGDPAGGGARGGGGTTPDGRIDINLATAQELETLPGIGPARAAAIVEYREANGPFTAPGELRNVSGIGEKIFQGLADLVTVG